MLPRLKLKNLFEKEYVVSGPRSISCLAIWKGYKNDEIDAGNWDIPDPNHKELPYIGNYTVILLPPNPIVFNKTADTTEKLFFSF